MRHATHSPSRGQKNEAGQHDPQTDDYAFDLLRGVAAYVDNGLVASLARTVAAHPDAQLDVAFNHKQVACKLWAKECLLAALGPRYRSIWVMGGWYGIMAAMLFDDRRFDIGRVVSFDLDPAVEAVATTVNAAAAREGRFRAVTADMYALDYENDQPDLVINTSCEHIADLKGWLWQLAEGTPVLLQSNDYAAEPTHVNVVYSEEEFAGKAGLSSVLYQGRMPQKHYTRFMLIGRR
ncbi:MAG: class I SAM-dependent methyltransferase [Hyphomicrobiales bacterium]